jgi:hypothetical protein
VALLVVGDRFAAESPGSSFARVRTIDKRYHRMSLNEQTRTAKRTIRLVWSTFRRIAYGSPERMPQAMEQEQLRQLLDRRADLVKMQTAEKNRLKAPMTETTIKASLKRTLVFLEKEIAKVEERIQ